MYIIKFIIYTNSSWILFNTFPWLICCTPFLGGPSPWVFAPWGTTTTYLGNNKNKQTVPRILQMGWLRCEACCFEACRPFSMVEYYNHYQQWKKQKWLFGVYRGWYYPTMWGYTKPIIRSLSSSQDSIGNYPMFFSWLICNHDQYSFSL